MGVLLCWYNILLFILHDCKCYLPIFKYDMAVDYTWVRQKLEETYIWFTLKVNADFNIFAFHSLVDLHDCSELFICVYHKLI